MEAAALRGIVYHGSLLSLHMAAINNISIFLPSNLNANISHLYQRRLYYSSNTLIIISGCPHSEGNHDCLSHHSSLPVIVCSWGCWPKGALPSNSSVLITPRLLYLLFDLFLPDFHHFKLWEAKPSARCTYVNTTHNHAEVLAVYLSKEQITVGKSRKDLKCELTGETERGGFNIWFSWKS